MELITVDFIIVGQGLAGSTLAYFLVKQEKSVLIIDKNPLTSCSKIAAGIIHPVTGRRIVKTWKADELILFAKQFYSEAEKETGEKLFYDFPVVEIFSSVKNRNDWLSRSAEQGYENYFGDAVDSGILKKYFHSESGGIEIKHSGFLDAGKYIAVMRNFLQTKCMIATEEFSHDDIKIEDSKVLWKNYEAEKIIFCEGNAAVNNPYIKNIPFLPAKGEILKIYSEELPEDKIFNQRMFIMPAGNHEFKVGSTYEWNFTDDKPTEKGRTIIESFLTNFMKVKYKIISHDAAIRPAVQDRRPIIGLHPSNTTVGIFNGLGTKGVMLAPFFANQFAKFLNHNSEIEAEVDIKRFKERI